MSRRSLLALALLLLGAACGTDEDETRTPRPAASAALVPEPPFAAIQYGTNGCIEVGVRPDAPFNQPKPRFLPADVDVTAGYPAFGYDPTDFAETSGLNACRYNFRDANAVTIGSGYCVQFGAGQRSGTGYDPLPADGTILNLGYVRRILQDYWPAMNAPTVPSTNATVINRQRSGAVAMAVAYFTDRLVMPPNYQDAAIYAAVAEVVNGALAAGPLPPPADPTPTIDGPNGGNTGAILGPYTIGANATGDVTVTVTDAEAFLDAAGTTPFVSGAALPPGGKLWLRSPVAATPTIHAIGPVLSDFGTLMVGDPNFRVQSMALAQPLVLNGKAAVAISITPGDPPRLVSLVSAFIVESGDSVTDTLRISGLTDSGTLETTLFGPLPPVNGTCEDLDWTSSPVARVFDPVVLNGDDTVTTPATVLDALGCYSFGATLTPEFASPATFPPGVPSETLRVIPRIVPPSIDVTTRVSRSEIRAGERVTDAVSVTGLLPGRTIVLTSLVYGPVAPVTPGTCDGVDWTAPDLQVFRTLSPVTRTTNGTYSTPSVELTQVGCYSFAVSETNDLVTGGQEPTIHGLGAPEEVVFVRPKKPML